MKDSIIVTPLTDKNGQSCFSRQDAEKLATMLADDPAQPFLFDSSCGYRTELMVGRLLEAGAPPEAVARVFQEVPAGDSSFMTAGDNGFNLYRLLGVPEGALKGEIPLGPDLKVKFLGKDRVLFQNSDENKGWKKPEGMGYMMNATNHPWQGDNHITAGIYVLDPTTNEALLTVIDPHLAKKGESALMTPREWKNRVHCEASVVVAGKVGQLSEILPECLTQEQKEKLDAAILKEGGSKLAGLKSLTPAQYNRVTAIMFGLDSDKKYKKQNHRDFTMASTSHFQGTVMTDWDRLTKKERQELIKKWADELKPLRDLQGMWQAKFPAIRPAFQRNPKSKPPSI
jgi:hypothetical protein